MLSNKLETIRGYGMRLDSTSAEVLHSAPVRPGRIGANFSNYLYAALSSRIFASYRNKRYDIALNS